GAQLLGNAEFGEPFFPVNLAPPSRPTHMRVSCPSCSTTYNIDDKRIPAGGAKLKCAKCQTTFPIRPGMTAAPAGAVPLPGVSRPPPASNAVPLPGASAPQSFDSGAGAIPLPGVSAPSFDSGAIPLPGVSSA